MHLIPMPGGPCEPRKSLQSNPGPSDHSHRADSLWGQPWAVAFDLPYSLPLETWNLKP